MQDTLDKPSDSYSSSGATPEPWQVQKAHRLMKELKQLLEHNDTVFDDESIRRQMEVLDRWMDSYRRKLVTADSFAQTATVVVCDLRDRLKLAVDESQRLEGEGGQPATAHQVEKTEELVKAVRRSEKLLDTICKIEPHN